MGVWFFPSHATSTRRLLVLALRRRGMVVGLIGLSRSSLITVIGRAASFLERTLSMQRGKNVSVFLTRGKSSAAHFAHIYIYIDVFDLSPSIHPSFIHDQRLSLQHETWKYEQC